MPRTDAPHFRKNLLALAACAALTPQGVWALDLVQEPPLPTAKSSFVAPNVIISIDDSGSMGFRLDQESLDGATNETVPNGSGVWPVTSRRMNILKYSLKEVFNDTTLIPDNKIRLAWQVLHNNGNSVTKYNDLSYWYGGNVANPGKGKTPGADNVNTTATGAKNKMRSLDATHRANFLSFVDYLLPNNGTPSHEMFSQADTYMRGALSADGPWAYKPGTTAEPYLGCRRNYHILMSDGRWNGTPIAVTDSTYRDNVTNLSLKDGKVYGGDAAGIAQTNLFRDTDTAGQDYSNTLADWAFFSWSKPLQTTGLTDANKLKPTKEYDNAPATETFTAGGKTVALQKYWNPKYNPATWPHMVTYTIGVSDSATTWPGSNTIAAPTAKTPFGYDGSFPDFVTNNKTWPAMSAENRRALDLWHAAINGRGRFYGITKAEDLKKAFEEIIGKINEEAAPLPDKVSGSGTASGANVSQTNVGTFVSVYSPKQFWKGWVQASPVAAEIEVPCPTALDPDKKCKKFGDPTKDWDGKTTADRLDDLTAADLNNRLILSWSDKWSSTAPKGGVPFKWATDESNLSSPQKALLGKEDSDSTATVYTKGSNVLGYIRGNRTLEGTADPESYPAAKPFRERKSRQGDIVNSKIWYTGVPASSYSISGYGAFANTYKSRTPMLYVGGNDGMLHGFSAVDGREKIAYVPRGVIGDLKKLANPSYSHQYFVDGSPMTGDVQLTAGWATMLVSSLGAGGKGYFVLDVTDPASFATAETPTAPVTAKTLVKRDRTRGNLEVAPNCSIITDAIEKAACTKVVEEDKDIGNIVAPPVLNPTNSQQTTQITRMNNSRWAVVMGNGYNSYNERPVLLIQYLDGDMELKSIPATPDAKGVGNAKDNGLSAPAMVDLDGDGRVDVVYAGDNLGNLWKFDLTSDVDGNWKVAFGTNKPLFTAQGPKVLGGARDQAQPITAPPIVRANDRLMTIGSGASAKDVAVGGLMVAFGTGRNVTAEDRDANATATPNVQTLYSVLDNTRYRKSGTHLEVHPGGGTCPGTSCIPAPKDLGVGVTNAKLRKQSSTVVSGGYSTIDATEELKTSNWKDYNGWYLDLPTKGERLLEPMQFFDGSNILAVYSGNPAGTQTASSGGAANESCTATEISTAPGTQFRTLLNIMDGKRPQVQLVDMNGNGVYDATTDKNVSRAAVSTGTPMLITKGKRILELTGNDGTTKPEELNRMPEQSLRPTWRQLK